MNFQFDVKLNDKDYIDFNRFMIIRSPYGKKQIKDFRLTLAVVFFICFLLGLLVNGVSNDIWFAVVFFVFFSAIVQLLIKPFFSWTVKFSIKTMKKTGKAGYSPESVLEFGDETFIETTPDNKTEQRYVSIERISIVDNKMVYIHVNNIMAYILPLSCFETKEQYDEFFEFIKTKSANIDIY